MEFVGITLTEWIGYLASFFVMISFFMRNIITLRYVNSVGCSFFYRLRNIIGLLAGHYHQRGNSGC